MSKQSPLDPTKPQISTDEVVEIVEDMVAMRKKRSHIRDMIFDINGGPCSRTTVDKIIFMARANIMAREKTDVTEQRAKALEFYEAVIREDNVSVQQKLEAQKQLVELLGLGAKHNVNALTPQDAAARAREALRKMREQTDAEDSRPDAEGEGTSASG